MSTEPRGSVFKGKTFEINLGKKTAIMGIINVTPNSFSDGGETFSIESAAARAIEFQESGADIIDIGGESTRPGSDPVSLDEELKRVMPVIIQIREKISIPISIDTYKSKVAEEALCSGADIVNDISAGSFDPEMKAVVARHECGVILMHMKGTPANMQLHVEYDNLIGEIKQFLCESVEIFIQAGVERQSIMVDPGIGFGKNLKHNLRLIKHLRDFKECAAGVLMGPSRKSFLGSL
nr:dihydropteroate synthase [bacterium]